MAQYEKAAGNGDGSRGGGCVGAGLDVQGSEIAHELRKEIGGGGGEQLGPLLEAVHSGQRQGEDAEEGARGEEAKQGAMAAMEEEDDGEKDQQVWLEKAEGEDGSGEEFVAVNGDEEDVGQEEGDEECVLAEAGAGDEGEEADHPDAEVCRGFEPYWEFPEQDRPEGDVDGDEYGLGGGEGEPGQRPEEERGEGGAVEVDAGGAGGETGGLDERLVGGGVVEQVDFSGGDELSGEVELREIEAGLQQCAEAEIDDGEGEQSCGGE